MAYLPSQPDSIGGVLDNALRLYRGSLRAVLLLSMVYALITQLPRLLMAFLQPQNAGAAEAALGMTFLVALPISIIGGIISYIALVDAMHTVARGEQPRIGGSVRRGFSKFFPMIGLGILVLLCILGGLILLIIPGIILMLSLMFSAVCLIVEDESIIDAIKRSHRLVWGDWWRTAAEITVIGILYYLPVMGAGFVLGAIGYPLGLASNPVAFNIGLQLVVTAVIGLMFPLMTAGYLAVYYDLDLRKGGGDLEARLSATG